MANIRSGNTYYIDSASVSLEAPGIQVIGVILTGDGGVAELVLGDNISGASYPTKLSVRTADDTTIYLDLSVTPIVFTNGIRVATATNTKATLILRESKQ